jgi:hypothetical protein
VLNILLQEVSTSNLDISFSMIGSKSTDFGRGKLLAGKQMVLNKYRHASISMGNMFQDLSWLHETADNTECYI